jgi:hypothetical protein
MLRKCTKCGTLGVLTTDFYRHKSTKTGYHTQCKQCYKKITARNYQANRAQRIEAAKAHYEANRPSLLVKQKKRTRLRRYKLTDEQFKAKILEQNNQCALCPATEPKGQGTWHIDHDHDCCPGRETCGKCLRGLLCLSCNTKMSTKDNVAWNLRADAYKAKYKQSGDNQNASGNPQ